MSKELPLSTSFGKDNSLMFFLELDNLDDTFTLERGSDLLDVAAFYKKKCTLLETKYKECIEIINNFNRLWTNIKDWELSSKRLLKKNFERLDYYKVREYSNFYHKFESGRVLSLSDTDLKLLFEKKHYKRCIFIACRLFNKQFNTCEDL
ncbi:hypothetical protein ABK040_013052 [Willaertia magna]